jgi:predicted metal-dependent RNase
MNLSFFGGAGEVGRSCFVLEFDSHKIMIDAGLKIGGKPEEKFPLFDLKSSESLDCIVITHAHIDHIGWLPFIVKNGFIGKIFATKPTRDLMHLLLSDAAGIAKENKENFYNTKDIDKTMELVQPIEYDKETQIMQGVTLTFLKSGHILGAAQALLEINGKNLLYTSDLNVRSSNLLDAAELPNKKIDFLIIESTYSGKTDLLPSLKIASKELADTVKKVIKRQGKVLIPSFAVGRGQEIMLVLENYLCSGYLPELTIFVDGMIGKANKICRHNVTFLKEEIPKRILLADDDPFKFPMIKKPKARNKSDVFKTKKAVILATSGMLSGGPSVFYLQKLIGSKKNCIIFVGYQAPESLGRKLLDGAKEIEIKNKKFKVKIEAKNIRFSGHADFNGLLEFATKVNASQTILVHGEKEKILDLQQALEKKLGKKVFAPSTTEKIELS